MEMSNQLHAPASLLPGKQPPIPVGEETAWAPERIWTLWSTEKSLVSAGNRTPTVQSVTRDIPTEPPRLPGVGVPMYPFYLKNKFSSFFFSVGGGVSLVIPVKGTRTQKLLTTRGHDVIVFSWNQENARFDSLTNSKNVSVIARVETNPAKSGNRWNDGKADAKGRLWAGMSLGQDR
jgi:hypothetical protein